ncbi:hypothetical protein JL722_10109 [Aureococcus anophagefferens]|nr:hypothetical protein JL722_10109 [Aureococcus anophagefferens]
MAKDKASTRKPRRRNARARDDGGTRRATEATPPVRASKRLSVQVSAAASAFLVNFRLRLDAIASIFVNYHEEREALVEKTEAADLIEQNVAEMMGSTSQIADEGGPATHQLVAATVIPDRSAARARAIATEPPRDGRGFAPRSCSSSSSCSRARWARAATRSRLQFDFVLMLCRRLGVKDVFLFATEAGAPAWLTLGFEHVGSSASLIHLRFDLLFKRDRGVLARSARVPETSRLAAARWTALKIFSDSAGLYPMERVAEYGEKQVVRLAKEAANAAAEAEAENDVPAAREVSTDAPEHDSLAAPSPPRASDEGWEESDEDDPVEDLIHRERIRERDLLRTPGCLALGRKAFRLEDMPRVTERDREILRRVLYILREAERRNCGELEVPRPREWALSELGDTMTTEAIRARFDLRRDDGVFFCVRLQRLFPNLDFRLSWSVRFNVVVQTIDAIALDSNLELTRVDMEVRRSTVGVYEDSLACQLLGQTYYVHPDKTIKITVDLVVTSEVIGAFPRTAPSRAEVQIKELGFHFVDPLAPIAEKEIVPRVRVFIPYLGIEGWISITSRGPALDDGHLIVELKYLQAMHAEGEYQLALSNYRQMELWCFFKLDMALLAPDAAGVIRKFANAIARKAAEARGETFVPTPYDETAVDAVVVTAVPPVAPVVAPEPAPPAVSAPAGPPLKALEAMSAKECTAELDAAGVPKKGRDVTSHGVTTATVRDLVRRLRAGEPAATIKVPRKPKSAEELFVLDKAEQLAYAQPECGVRYPYGSKLGLFKGRVGGGVRDFERLASVLSETRVRERLDAFDSTPRPRETSAL